MFESKIYPEMNIFLQELEDVLKKMQDEEKILYRGFCLVFFNPTDRFMTSEIFGLLPSERIPKFLELACSRVIQMLYFRVSRSEQLVAKIGNNNMERQGALQIGGYGSGVGGENSAIDEAIAFLFLVAKCYVLSAKDSSIIIPGCPVFWEKFEGVSKDLATKCIPDNPRVFKMIELFMA